MEEQLDDNTRNEVLKQVFIKPKSEEQPVSKINEEKIDEKTDFATLLEKSIERRAKVDNDEAEISDDIRKKLLNESNFNIIKNWKF
jgi:hypothetical protein